MISRGELHSDSCGGGHDQTPFGHCAARAGEIMTSPGSDQPAEAAQPAAGTNQPPVQRPVVSPLLTSAVDDATREKLVYTIDDRQAVLVELSLSTGAPTADIRDQFRDVFHAAFAQDPQQPPDPIPISANYMRCLLTPDEVTKLADQDTEIGRAHV